MSFDKKVMSEIMRLNEYYPALRPDEVAYLVLKKLKLKAKVG